MTRQLLSPKSPLISLSQMPQLGDEETSYTNYLVAKTKTTKDQEDELMSTREKLKRFIQAIFH